MAVQWNLIRWDRETQRRESLDQAEQSDLKLHAYQVLADADVPAVPKCRLTACIAG